MRSIKDENPPDALMWEEALKRKAEGGQPFGRKEWDQLLGHCEVGRIGSPEYFHAHFKRSSELTLLRFQGSNGRSTRLLCRRLDSSIPRSQGHSLNPRP